jgi:myosin heavy subunit
MLDLITLSMTPISQIPTGAASWTKTEVADITPHTTRTSDAPCNTEHKKDEIIVKQETHPLSKYISYSKLLEPILTTEISTTHRKPDILKSRQLQKSIGLLHIYGFESFEHN